MRFENQFYFQGTYGRTQPSPGSRSPAFNQYGNVYNTPNATSGHEKRNNNLSELETLLQDLSNSQEERGKYSYSSGNDYNLLKKNVF